MKNVVIESPWSGDVERHLRYLRACLLDSLERGEAPYASHGLYTQALPETPDGRAQGIQAGRAWMARADLVAFYVDLCDIKGTPGMNEAARAADDAGVPTVIRRLGDRRVELEERASVAARLQGWAQ